MKKIITLIILIVLLPSLALAATRVRAFDALTGGGTNDMDSVDGDNIAAGDFAFTVDSSGNAYRHYFVASGSCSTDDSPNIIYPDSCSGDTNKGYWKLITSFSIYPSATPGIYGEDSDYGNDPVIQIIGNSQDGTDGEILIKVQEGDTLVTYIDIDALQDRVEVLTDLNVTGAVDGGICINNATSATVTVSSICEQSGYFFNGDDDVIEFDLPADAANKRYCFNSADYAKVVTIDPDSSDYIVRHGVTAAAGEAIVSSGAIGEFVCLVGLTNAYWVTMEYSGTWAEESPP